MRKDEILSDLSSSGSLGSPLLSCCALSDLHSEYTLENGIQNIQDFPTVMGLHTVRLPSRSSWCFQTMLSSLPQDCLHTSNKHVWNRSARFSWQSIAQMGLLLILSILHSFFSARKCLFSDTHNLKLTNEHLSGGWKGKEKKKKKGRKLSVCYL